MFLFLVGPLFGAPIGIRNNNPGNIKSVHVRLWRGAERRDAADYLVFSKPLYGLKAMNRLLAIYGRRGHYTIDAITTIWTEPKATQRDALAHKNYMIVVCKLSGFGRHECLDMRSWSTRMRLARGIIMAENSCNPYPESLLRQAFHP